MTADVTQALRVNLLLSAQRALLGQIPPSLRAVSVDVDSRKVYFRCVFDGEPEEDEWELLSCAASKIIADFSDPFVIVEEYWRTPRPERMEHLRHLVYLRHEVES